MSDGQGGQVGELLDAVREMRRAQRAQQADPKRSLSKLTAARRLERRVDELLREHDFAKRQAALPFDGPLVRI